jgi:hypothetical protein
VQSCSSPYWNDGTGRLVPDEPGALRHEERHWMIRPARADSGRRVGRADSAQPATRAVSVLRLERTNGGTASLIARPSTSPGSAKRRWAATSTARASSSAMAESTHANHGSGHGGSGASRRSCARTVTFDGPDLEGLGRLFASFGGGQTSMPDRRVLAPPARAASWATSDRRFASFRAPRKKPL